MEAASLSPASAVALSVCVACSYVAAIAAVPARLRQLPRDHPDHVSLGERRR
jgi:hypothetical protein